MNIYVLEQEFQQDLAQTELNTAALSQLKTAYLGKKGKLRALTQNLKELSLEEKKAVGQKSNELKVLFEEQIKRKQQQVEYSELDSKLKQDWFDYSLSEEYWGELSGAMHPISFVQQELEDIFFVYGLPNFRWATC